MLYEAAAGPAAVLGSGVLYLLWVPSWTPSAADGDILARNAHQWIRDQSLLAWEERNGHRTIIIVLGVLCVIST